MRSVAIAVRVMDPADWDAVRTIYADGIALGTATFETQVPSWEAWDKRYSKEPRLVAVDLGSVAGFAAVSPVSSRAVYRGVAEFSIYVAATQRGRGIGKALVKSFVEASERAGIWTLQTGTFPENGASIALVEGAGFRKVGLRERIGCLDGIWKDVVVYERRSPRVGTSGS